MSAGSVYKLTVIGRTPLQDQLVNTFHYKAVAGTILEKQTDDLIAAFYNGGTGSPFAEYLDCFANTIGVDRIEARELTGDALEFGELDITETGTGGSGDVLPPQCSAVISWRTGNIGRSFRGRTYMFPTLEGNQNNGQWGGTYQGVLSAFADAALTIGDGILTDAYQLVVWSRFSEGQLRETPLATVVTTSHVPIFVHTQRRRVHGVGS
jgi:hypothetical protein